MRLSVRVEWPHWLILAGLFLTGALTWPNAPERFPVHWGIDGQVDRWGDKFEGVWLLPLAALGLYLLLLVLPNFDPNRANYAQFASAYNAIRLAILALMAGVYAVMQLVGQGLAVPVATIIPLMIGLLFIVIGNLMGKMRPNWFCGIRTPWTLASKLAWVKTHRLGGWLFLGLGVAMVVSSLTLPAVATFAITIGGVLGVTGVTFIYSYLVWRSDPTRASALETRPADEAATS